MSTSDPLFQVRILRSTPDPQQVIYAAMHQDYSAQWIGDADLPDEQTCGRIAVERLLVGGRGHYGPLEHPQITFAVGHFPHSVMQQARTHRIGVSFDVQSMRYTSESILHVADRLLPAENAFYIRPAGCYRDRQGGQFVYTEEARRDDLLRCQEAAVQYAHAVRRGMPEEQARGMMPFDYRQHFVVSFTMRALMHFLDLRGKADAQLEIQQLSAMLMDCFGVWAPQVHDWYLAHRWQKGRLAP